MALEQTARGHFLCNFGGLRPVVLPLGGVPFDFGSRRLGLLVERGAGLGLLQGRISVLSSQELLHAILQEPHVHLVTFLLLKSMNREGKEMIIATAGSMRNLHCVYCKVQPRATNWQHLGTGKWVL